MIYDGQEHIHVLYYNILLGLLRLQCSISVRDGTVMLRETKLEDLTALKRSPDLLNNVKIGQDQLRLII